MSKYLVVSQFRQNKYFQNSYNNLWEDLKSMNHFIKVILQL